MIVKQYFVSSEKRLLMFISALVFFIGILSACTLIPETDPVRGATTVKQDQFGDSYTTVKYLDQGWDNADSLWFYTTTQGSNLMPYDFFMVLEQPKKPELFRADDNMNFYRYLPQKATASNPDALPVGWVKDGYKGREFIGLTCAACHTGQVNYNGVGIRIDGGPAGADMENIMKDLAKALYYTRENEEVRNRFVKNVLARGNYKSEKEVLDDLDVYKQRIASYITINHSDIAYGYARLDAFGRIYNRVLEHLVNERVLRELLRDGKLADGKDITEEDLNKITQNVSRVMSGEERDSVVNRLVETLGWEQLGHLRKKLFNPPNAPVSYPFLWDIPQHDYVQWNGLAANAGLGPVGRNTGEVIGVFGTLDWREEKGTTLSTLIGKTDINFTSSVNVHNLRRIESHLQKLQSPEWPEEILGAIDKQSAARGRPLFNEYCASCHTGIDRADPERRVVAKMSRISDVGTDPAMAKNSTEYAGFSGILRNQYVGLGVGDILLDQEAPVAALLTKATLNVVATPDPDKLFFRRWAEWILDIAKAFFHNEIKSSIKHGNYDPDTTVSPLASLNAYKARPLNGIWATAPYLHNGSVPTLYDLLLPKKRPGDSEDGEYRPEQFEVGSREFDPVRVGFKSSGYQGFTFKTTDQNGEEIRGNSNAGHEYASGKTAQPNGKILKPLTKEQKLDLLEYLKTL
ncbi:di-heme-cytochrome C peroxidase [Nitrosomonas sp.]|uniref:di-heme-cytochrome C peroxidase n=1 Tax=Nitrosomonas sp. TaxID=42353 RepID=UPI0026172270|nr:di-heme-cytochrome C peroxidase [Nitrosomonas sp.]